MDGHFSAMINKIAYIFCNSSVDSLLAERGCRVEFSQAVCFDESLTIFVVHVTFQTLMFTQQVFLITFFSAMSVWPLSHFTYWTELSLLDINRMLLRINAKTKFPLCHFTRLLKQSWPIRQDSAWFVAVIIVTGDDRLKWSVEIKKIKKVMVQQLR